MSEAAAAAPIPGQVDVDEVLELVAREPPRPAARVRGELVGALEPVVDAFVATVPDVEQTQRTCRQARARSSRGSGLRQGQVLTLRTLSAYQAELAAPRPDGRRPGSATARKRRGAMDCL